MARRRRRGDLERLATPGTIGRRIRDYRQMRGLDYDDLIEACKGVWRSPGKVGISKSWLMKLEKGRVYDLGSFTVMTLSKEGKAEPRVGGFPAIAARLVKLFGCSVADLLEAD